MTILTSVPLSASEEAMVSAKTTADEAEDVHQVVS